MKQFLFIALIVALFFFGAQFYQEDAVPLDVSDNLEQAIIDSCLYERNADVSEFEVSPEEMEDIVLSLHINGRLPWYIDASSGYMQDPVSGHIIEFCPRTILGGNINKALYEQKVAEILDTCVLEGMSQYQMALALHDYLVLNSYYDETLTKHSGYELLIDGSAVCAGYALAYQDLLSRVGIDSVYVISKEMNHGWNLVNIDGQWYHVDVTWDDTKPDVYGYVSHDYFLLTDEEISSGEEPHHSWTAEISCTDTRFSNAYWRNVNSQICFSDYDTCYVLRSRDYVNSIYLRRESTGKETLIHQVKKSSVNIGAGPYYYSHYGLSYWEGKLYFNTPDRICSINPDGSSLRDVYTYKVNDNKKIIRSNYVSNGTAFVSVSDHDENLAHFTFSLAEDCHAHSYKKSIQEASCSAQGCTLYSCECGISFQCNLVEPAKHDYKLVNSNVTNKTTKTSALVQVCSVCGDTSDFVLTKTVVKEWVSEHIVVILLVWGAIVMLLVVLGKKKDKRKSQ